ncbi:MAG: glycosyltransferase [Actinomycetota bacterium]|nr:glycosyltransferase [Actinomycetota bacterium]
MTDGAIDEVVYLSVHTSPLLAPGTGDAGGMNVYIDELATTMTGRGVDVTVFTRRSDPEAPEVVEAEEGYRVVHVTAGPPQPLAMTQLPMYVGEFTETAYRWLDDHGQRPDLLHSHYWLSGWAGVVLKEMLDLPLANSFHTLGRVKDLARRVDEPLSSSIRTLTETEVIAQSDCVIASTPHEFDDLVQHYGARLERLCLSPPGVDHDLFLPGDRRQAREWLGLPEGIPIVLFVGRIQPHKGPDVAVEAAAMLSPSTHLLVIGGASGAQGAEELARVQRRVDELDIDHRVHFLPNQPHRALPRFYQAANVLMVPSRSESFGLVAAEAQACGLPVVAAATGGLPYVIDDGVTGTLVAGHDPANHAAAVQAIIDHPEMARAMAQKAAVRSERFSWSATADRLLELYRGILG